MRVAIEPEVVAFGLVTGVAETVSPRGRFAKEHAEVVQTLRAGYPQYQSSRIDQRPVIKITPQRVTLWRATNE